MTSREYKELSLKEFSKAATVYETDQAGVYKMCKKDYPDVLAELEKEDFNDLLEVRELCSRAGLKMELFEERGLFRLHCVAKKPA